MPHSVQIGTKGRWHGSGIFKRDSARRDHRAGNLPCTAVRVLAMTARIAVVFVFIAALELAGCTPPKADRAIDNASALKDVQVLSSRLPIGEPQPAAPSLNDASQAISTILGLLPGRLLKFGQIGAPERCAAGTVAGEPVMACTVCMKVISFKNNIDTIGDMMAQKLEVAVVFKRAISVDQPSITPPPGELGVWIVNQPNPMLTGVPNTLHYSIAATQSITPDDLTAMGFYVRADSGTYQVGTRPLGGHSAGLSYMHIPESALEFIAIITQREIPASLGSGLGECPAG